MWGGGTELALGLTEAGLLSIFMSASTTLSPAAVGSSAAADAASIHRRAITLAGVLVTMGIIFGDIGTSPLYVFQTILGKRPVSELLVYGGVSAVFWTLTVQTSIKYIWLTLQADNHGEGGIFSLYSLVRHRGRWLLWPAIIGASTLLADGIITPPISVSSAIEGVLIFYPTLDPVPFVVVILTLLFAFQQFGTRVVGASFGPIMLVWFLVIGGLGLAQVVHYPGILKALNPGWAVRLLTEYPQGFWLLGAVFLCTTGAEALYSDLGHCGRRNIRAAWVFVKLTLVLSYMGQGAWAMQHVGRVLASNENPFFMIAPTWAVVPLIVLATAATIIASQALISGSYTLISEAVSLQFWPKVRVLFPTDQKGQIYVPSINWLLWAGCVAVQLWFRSSEHMQAAYGFSITVAMLMTSVLLAQYLRGVRHWALPAVGVLLLLFMTVELAFLVANITKLLNRLGILVFEWGLIVMMWLGYRGRQIKNSLLDMTPLAPNLPILHELSQDESVARYASNLVYLTRSKQPDEIESSLLYSILRKRPKRADHYWFVHMSILPQPYKVKYRLEELIPGVAYKISFKLGFRVQPRLNLLLRRVLEEMSAKGEIDLTSRYATLHRHHLPGDFRFVVLEKVLSPNNQLTFRERFILAGYFLLNRFAVSDQQLFGLDTSDVVVEKVPLVLKPVSADLDVQREAPEPEQDPVPAAVLAAADLPRRLAVVGALLLAGLTATAQTTDTAAAIAARVPFEGMDLTWINGQNRQRTFPLQVKDANGETVVTGVALADTYFNYNFARPVDNTQTISAVTARANEFSLALATIGLETNYKNMIGRLWLQTGSMAAVVQETDGSVLRGRNTGTGNLKFVREVAAGYHFNKAYGLNVEAGIFMSYIGLESYIMQENWSYQRSLVCDFTPFYFQGARVQFYPTRKFKTELWLMNGWQTYNSFNRHPSVGSSNYYRPSENVQLVANFYFGNDSRPGTDSAAQGYKAYPKIYRFHHDNSIVARYYHKPAGQLRGITQAAFSLNTHYGFQSGDGLRARDNFMTGTSLANRIWFAKNKLALTVRAGFVQNPSRYLSFTPAVAGADGSNAFLDTDPGKLTAKEVTGTFDVMPNDFVTFRFEYLHRTANVPYFAGRGGTTSPSGYADQPIPAGWQPDLRRTENRAIVSVNFRL